MKTPPVTCPQCGSPAELMSSRRSIYMCSNTDCWLVNFSKDEAEKEHQRAQAELKALRWEIGMLMSSTVAVAIFWWIAILNSNPMWCLLSSVASALLVWLFQIMTSNIAGRIRGK